MGSKWILASIIILGSITLVVLLGVMVESAHSQNAPEPVMDITIEGCGGPDIDSVMEFQNECDVKASDLMCMIGIVHPINDVVTMCRTDPECNHNYCVSWGCFVHGCNETF